MLLPREILPHFYSMATIQCPMPIYHLLQEGKQTVTHKADAAVLLLNGVLSKRSSYDDVVLGVLNHTIHCAGSSLLYLLGYAFYGICHIGVVTLCKTGCGGSYYHHQRNHNLLHTLLYIKGLYFMFLVPRFFLFYRFPITSAKVRRLFLSAKYLNLPCMKCHSVCTK